MNNIIDLTAATSSSQPVNRTSSSTGYDTTRLNESDMRMHSHNMISNQYYQPQKSTYQPYISSVANFESAINNLSKQRKLPTTVLSGIHTGPKAAYTRDTTNPGPFKSYVSQPMNTTGRVLPSYANKPHEQNLNRQYPIIIIKAKITFSLIDTYRFSIKAGTTGKVTDDVMTMLRAVQGSKFNWKTCQWEFPLEVHDILQVALAKCGHTVDALPREIIAAAQLKNQRDSVDNPEESLLNLKGTIPDSVLHCLAPFQRDAVLFVLRNKGRALIADEMGLGKTRTAIASAMAYFPDDWPLLVVCPSSARHHWQSEMLNILYPACIEPRDISIVENNLHPIGKSAHGFKAKVLIISFNLVSKMVDSLNQIPFNVVIVDECHYMKTSTARRTQCLVPLLHRAKNVILLSGTPALSRPMELFTQLNALAPKQWSNEKEFGKRYCVDPASRKARGSTNKSWSEFKGANNTQELHVLLTGSLMIRRMKKDILAQLPAKVRHIVKVGIPDDQNKAEMAELLLIITQYEEMLAKKRKINDMDSVFDISEANRDGYTDNGEMTQYKDHNEELADLKQSTNERLEELRKKKKHAILNLFNLSGQAKLPAILQKLILFLDDRLAGKVLVFCHHKTVMEGLVRAMSRRGEDFIRIDGQTNSKERHTRVQTFQNSSKCRVALLSITAAGIALTLTAAATVYFAELYWTPGSLLQAEDRAHRIGQNSTVHVTYFLADNTIDDLLWPLVRKKMKLLGEFVEGHNEGDIVISSSAEQAASSNALDKGDPDVDDDDVDEPSKRAVVEMGDAFDDMVKEIVVENKPKKDRASDDEDEEEDGQGGKDGSPSSDDESVVHIDDPDPLALMYMTTHGQTNSKRAHGSSHRFMQVEESTSLKSIIYGSSTTSNSSIRLPSSNAMENSVDNRKMLASVPSATNSCIVIDLQSDDEPVERNLVNGYDSDCLIVEDNNYERSVSSLTDVAALQATNSNRDDDMDRMSSDPLLPLDAQGLPVSLAEQRLKQLKDVAINKSRFVPSLGKGRSAPKPSVLTSASSLNDFSREIKLAEDKVFNRLDGNLSVEYSGKISPIVSSSDSSCASLASEQPTAIEQVVQGSPVLLPPDSLFY